MVHSDATTSYNFIDLFAGAGGLSEGFIQAGFSPVAHVEMNAYAAQTLETRTAYFYLKSQGRLNVYYDYIKGTPLRRNDSVFRLNLILLTAQIQLLLCF